MIVFENFSKIDRKLRPLSLIPPGTLVGIELNNALRHTQVITVLPTNNSYEVHLFMERWKWEEKILGSFISLVNYNSSNATIIDNDVTSAYHPVFLLIKPFLEDKEIYTPHSKERKALRHIASRGEYIGFNILDIKVTSTASKNANDVIDLGSDIF